MCISNQRVDQKQELVLLRGEYCCLFISGEVKTQITDQDQGVTGDFCASGRVGTIFPRMQIQLPFIKLLKMSVGISESAVETSADIADMEASGTELLMMVLSPQPVE